MCLIIGQCGGYAFESDCVLYYWLSDGDLDYKGGTGHTIIKVMPMRINKVGYQDIVLTHDRTDVYLSRFTLMSPALLAPA